MSKEFRCNLCKKNIITERENTLHTEYTYGVCEECSKPEPEPQKEKPNPLACKVCPFVAKTKGGLKLHKKVHKQ